MDNITALHQREDLGVTSDNRVASIWPLFVEELRRVAEWYPAHFSYVGKLIDDLGLENLF